MSLTGAIPRQWHQGQAGRRWDRGWETPSASMHHPTAWGSAASVHFNSGSVPNPGRINLPPTSLKVADAFCVVLPSESILLTVH